ncbi:MAG: HD domain-containing protein [Acidobacteriota bacterium]|nr:HD domain-containing protein [Acidobacteriota bacterium]
MPVKRNLPIAAWSDGDAVQGFVLLSRKERRQDRNGNAFLDLELTDASGSIAGKVWSDSPALDSDVEAHQFIAVHGQVKDYRGQLQVSVQKCRRAVDADREHGFDEALLVPTTQEDIGELYERLETLLRERLSQPLLRRLALETLDSHGSALREHPAAKSIHHAYRGGLLEHVVSMAELALAVGDRYPDLDRDVLLLGVLFHDLGKLLELGAMPANDYTRQGRLVGHIVLGRDLLRERCAAIDGFPEDVRLHVEHLVLSHHGELEFGSPVMPMTAEAFALAFIDNLDSKLAQLRQAARTNGGLQYMRALGRFVLLPESPDEELAGAGPSSGPEQTRLDL